MSLEPIERGDKPANPYADPDSPESVALRNGDHPALQPSEERGTLKSYKKECRDGGKGAAETKEELNK